MVAIRHSSCPRRNPPPTYPAVLISCVVVPARRIFAGGRGSVEKASWLFKWLWFGARRFQRWKLGFSPSTRPDEQDCWSGGEVASIVVIEDLPTVPKQQWRIGCYEPSKRPASELLCQFDIVQSRKLPETYARSVPKRWLLGEKLPDLGDREPLQPSIH